ncbi:hypothetical protein ACIRYZ_45310 [Kitasatospora sp. NPDC101155]|uniref:hypothetical protein n=1 Tax=Kitasatospora sp. NPDC101155 TaxID=3364097 RepID=UPI00382FE9AF
MDESLPEVGEPPITTSVVPAGFVRLEGALDQTEMRHGTLVRHIHPVVARRLAIQLLKAAEQADLTTRTTSTPSNGRATSSQPAHPECYPGRPVPREDEHMTGQDSRDDVVRPAAVRKAGLPESEPERFLASARIHGFSAEQAEQILAAASTRTTRSPGRDLYTIAYQMLSMAFPS